MDKKELIKKVEEKINLLLKEFEEYPESFDYEGDMVCRLYRYLAQIDDVIEKINVEWEERNKDQLLHCEVPTLDSSDKFDLVIFDHQKEKAIPFIAIECKFDENNHEKIEKDFEKLEKPETKVQKAYFILLKKWQRNNFNEKFKRIKDKYTNVNVYYKFKEC